MTPANLKDPFGPSCCDGGACSEVPLSAQPCGCDPAAGWTCNNHKLLRACEDLIGKWKCDIELLLKGADCTNDELTEAKLRVEAERLAIDIVQLEDVLYG